MSYYIQTENTETFICDWQEGGGVKAFHRNLNPEIARYWNPIITKKGNFFSSRCQYHIKTKVGFIYS